MTRFLLRATMTWIAVLATCLCAEEPMDDLPKPHYHREASDPAWLAAAVQFHGHLGPWAAAGLRAGMAGRRAVGAEGYFDLEVTVEGPLVKPPQSCFLDGVQVSTGATLGKRNLTWVEADRVVVRVRNTQTGKTAEVRPTAALMKLVTSLKAAPKAAPLNQDDHQRDDQQAPRSRADAAAEALARKIAAAPQQEILTVTFPQRPAQE